MNTYPHMCRDGHVQIGHSDSENEMCPLCVALAQVRAAEWQPIETAHRLPRPRREGSEG